MNDEARQKLREIVGEIGSNVSDNPQVWKGYLTDRLAEYTLERQALISALNENIPDDLLSSQISLPPVVQIERLTQKLVDRLGLQNEVARWAVESWAVALGVLSPNDVTKIPFPGKKTEPIKKDDVYSKRRRKSKLLSDWKIVTGVTVGSIVLLGFGWRYFFGQKELLWGGDGTLTVGVLVPNRNSFEPGYSSLEEYLESNLKQRLRTKVEANLDLIEITGRKSTEEVKERLSNKSWDIAFTLSPLLSVAARDNGYIFAAQMFPGRPQFESVLFVREDSPIFSEADLTPDKIIALEGPGSAHGFYMPVYDLYGKSLQVDSNNSTPQEIIEKVDSGRVDVGAGIYQVLTNPRQTKKFRIIKRSRGIPRAGVYISPNLDDTERDAIRESLLSAPTKIQENARYAKGAEPDYSQFEKIVKRVDEFLECTKWSPTPSAQSTRVSFFCSNDIIVGKFNGYSQFDKDNIRLTLQVEGGKVYYVLLPQTILQTSDLPPATELSSQRVSINGVQPLEEKGWLYLRITEPGQIKILAE